MVKHIKPNAIIREADSAPTGIPTELVFPNDSLSYVGNVATIDLITPLAGTYLKLDCSNGPLTGNLDLDTYNLDTSGNLKGGSIRTNNYQNSIGDESLIWNAGEDRWQFGNDLYVVGNIESTIAVTATTLTDGTASLTGGSLTSVVDITMTGDLLIDSDSGQLKLGADQDLLHYHDGTNGYADCLVGDYKINSSGLGDVRLFGDRTYTGDANALFIERNGEYFKLYVDSSGDQILDTTQDFFFRSADRIVLLPTTNLELGGISGNPIFYHYGNITAEGGQKRIQWQVEDSYDYLKLSRQAGIMGFHCSMPLKVETSTNTEGLLINRFSGTIGDSANILFKTSSNTSDGYYKGGVSFVDNGGASAAGDLYLGVNTVADMSNFAYTDAQLKLNTAYVLATVPIYFTQTDGNESIDSVDNYMQYYATLGHRFDAPITIASSTLLATPVAGTIEYDGCSTYLTNVSTRKAIDRTSDVAVATVTVNSSTTETVLWTGAMAANSLCAGNLFKFHADGIIENTGNTATDEVTLRIRVGGIAGTIIATLNPKTKAISADSHWHIDANSTQRTIGASGQRAAHIDLAIETDSGEVTEKVVGIATVNTTNNMDVVLTAEWASADANNTISLYQGFMEYKN